jgi:hypothetical protein
MPGMNLVFILFPESRQLFAQDNMQLLDNWHQLVPSK